MSSTAGSDLLGWQVAHLVCPREAPVPGKITRIAVTYTIDTPDGPRHTFHGLPHMHRHIRAERLSELLDDSTLICEELVAVREPAPGNGLIGLPRRTR
jgi:hypothetical protein